MTGEVGTLAVVNLGLSTAQAKKWQCDLRYWNFNPGTIDGQLVTNSWEAAQRLFNYYGDTALAVDGVVGPNTIITGIAGRKTKDAFAAFAGQIWQEC
ncbi:peptidoglycan-binding protein [Streptomyces sp. NPDC060209]|uniref:peptidoglycan-binding domain-containing protein n=1 Tax=Streptomyces sp. NPDC060209 TaxID=3347073 RepID=UPI003655366A